MMVTPAFTQDQNPTPARSLPPIKKRPKPSSCKPEPRSPGFVLRSRRPNAATNVSEFVEVYQTNRSIRTIVNEVRQERPSNEFEAIPAGHQKFKEQIKRMLRIHPLPQQKVAKDTATISPVSTITQQTPGGRKYQHIGTGKPWERELNVSTYNVNNTTRAASAAANEPRKPNRIVSDVTMDPVTKGPPISGGISLPRPKQKQSAKEARDHNKIDIFLSSKNREEIITQTGIATGFPKPPVHAPVIPSPRKSVYRGLGLAGDWAESFSASQESPARDSPTQVSISKADNETTSRDFATGGANSLQRLRDNRRRSGSPEKEAELQNVVAGLPHNYQASASPSFRQRFQERQASDNQRERGLPTISPKRVRGRPSAPQSSLVAINPEGKPILKPSPNIEQHSMSPSVVSAESAAENVQSEASSGLFLDAQSALFLRGQIVTGHYHAAKTHLPPMPGPPPCGALPPLPEAHNFSVPATPRISESSQRVHSHESSPGMAIVATNSSRRPESSFLPSDCRPPKIHWQAPAEHSNETQAAEQVIPTSTQIRVKRQGRAFPRPEQPPKSASALELDQWQQQRNEKTAALKTRDLAHMRPPKAAMEDVDAMPFQGTDSEEHHKGMAMLPSIRDSYASNLSIARHRPQLSASEASTSTTLQNKESSALSKDRKGSTLTQRLSPTMVVAKRGRIPPTSGIPLGKSLTIDGPIINEKASKPRFSRESTKEPSVIFRTNSFHPGVSPPVSPSLPPPDDETRANPASAYSMPTSRPVASRAPRPSKHSLLRAQPDHSSRRASTHEAQVSELEARLSASEKRNIMLERAFMAVINTSAAYPGFGGGGRAIGVDGGGRRLSNGDPWNGNGGNRRERNSVGSTTESLYLGLENLLALHATEGGNRLSTSSRTAKEDDVGKASLWHRFSRN